MGVMNGVLSKEEKLASRQKSIGARPYRELLVVHIQRGRRSGQFNGDITHHCVDALKMKVDGWEVANKSRHGRLEREKEREG